MCILTIHQSTNIQLIGCSHRCVHELYNRGKSSACISCDMGWNTSKIPQLLPHYYHDDNKYRVHPIIILRPILWSLIATVCQIWTSGIAQYYFEQSDVNFNWRAWTVAVRLGTSRNFSGKIFMPFFFSTIFRIFFPNFWHTLFSADILIW